MYEFLSNTTEPPTLIYLGKHKIENEELLKHGHDSDIWFHVDKHSSAHVYLRTATPISDLPADLIADAAQLCKANSIEGNKLDNICVIYTNWTNLRKTKGMEDGEVGFRKEKEVKRVHVAKKENGILNRLMKTRTEKLDVDLGQEKVDKLKSERKATRSADMAKRDAEIKEAKRKKQEAESQYQDVLKNEKEMKTNRYTAVEGETEVQHIDAMEEDFM